MGFVVIFKLDGASAENAPKTTTNYLLLDQCRVRTSEKETTKYRYRMHSKNIGFDLNYRNVQIVSSMPFIYELNKIN